MGIGTKGSQYWLQLPYTYTTKYLPVDKDDTATPSKLNPWENLKGIINSINGDVNLSQLTSYPAKIMVCKSSTGNLAGLSELYNQESKICTIFQPHGCQAGWH